MGTSSINTLLPHAATPQCFPYHCFSCDLDEYAEAGEYYLCCGECGHVYRTARELRREYRRKFWQIQRSYSRFRPWVFGNEFTPSNLEVLWRMLTVRVKDIYFCQKCIHNF